MKRKTRQLLLMLAFCLMTPAALAEDYNTLGEIRQQAEAGWHKTYEAHGRTITVDIPVEVPKADAFPVLTAVSMHPSNQVPSTPSGTAAAPAGQGPGLDNGEKVFTFSEPDVQAISSLSPIEAPARNLEPISEYHLLHEMAWDIPYAKNNPATLRDAHALMLRVAQTYFPDEEIAFVLWLAEAYVDACTYDYDAEEITGEPWAAYVGLLFVHFNQTLRGIPVLTHVEAAYKQPLAGQGESKHFHSKPDNLAVMYPLTLYGREDCMEQVYFSLLREHGVLVDDVPLCGLDQVITAYEGLIAAGQLRWVDGLRLGYVGWYNRETPEVMTLLPCWALNGMLYRDAQRGRAGYRNKAAGQANERDMRDAEYSTILINAQTGEMIDPWRTDKNRSYDQPHLIRWKDMK